MPVSVLEGASPFERIVIRLGTNAIDRGMLTISKWPPDLLTIQLRIGCGPNRSAAPIPADVAEFEFSAGLDGAAETPLELALQVIASQGQALLKTLATHA